ncbi:hypothetical protein ACFL46_02000 [Candidatus Neomarinimicrobiota bacterium]
MRLKLILAVIILLVITNCTSSLKQLQRGDYDSAVKYAVKNLRIDPTDQEEIEVLGKAYQLANQEDLDRIRYLNLEENPNSWDEIFIRYTALKNRQTLVNTILPLELSGRIIDYEMYDYDEAIIEAKREAAGYYWKHANQLIQEDTKTGYRQAYGELTKVKHYIGDYKNVNQLLTETKWLGISRVYLQLENRTHFKLSNKFNNDLMEFGAADLNSNWVEFYTKHIDEEIYLDYLVIIKLNQINVSTESITEKDRMETKEIEDGWDYILDHRGNVMKDSLGNDIKQKKYRTVACSVIETIQYKDASITGLIEFMHNESDQVIKTIPISAESIFEHISARAIGDIEALAAASKKMIKVDPMPFPHDLDLIYQSKEALKHSIRQALRQNRGMLN